MNIYKIKIPTLPFIIDLEIENNMMEFWIYHEEYGVKMHCIGLKENTLRASKIIKDNIADWIKEYVNEYIIDDVNLDIKEVGKCL